MSEDITPDQLATLKSRFRAAGCEVTDISENGFGICAHAFPVRTHVLVTPYFLQLGTIVTAIPGGILPNREGKLYAFLSVANRRAKIAKFTIEEEKPKMKNGGWPVFASFKFITGATGFDYDAEALNNLVLLWSQDIAELISSPEGFSLQAPMFENPAA